MIGQAQCHGDDGERWVGLAGGGEGGAAGDEQVAHAMYPAMFIDDAVARG